MVSKSPPKPHPTPTTIAKPEFPLIGREQEWQTIQARWRHCLSNGAHLICIGGEAGIGKTRLTEEARLWVAQQGYATAYARSYAAEGDLAYSPIVDWLRSEAIRPALQGLDPVWLTEVARLLPELLTTHPHLAPPQPIRDSSQRRHFFEALARAMGAGGQARLLVIDDLHWCDQETLEWLRYFLRFTAHQPCLVLGTFRVEEVEPDHPLHELLRSLHQSSQVTQFELDSYPPPWSWPSLWR
jgi:predicted ATPase